MVMHRDRRTRAKHANARTVPMVLLAFFMTLLDPAPEATAASDRLWSSSYDGSGAGPDSADATALSEDGSVIYTTGQTTDASGDISITTIAYDAANGDQIWVAVEPPAARTASTAIASSGDRVFVAGVSGARIVTIAYDAGSGAQLWSKSHKGGSYLASLAIDPSGRHLFVTGGRAGVRTISYRAATGATRWSRHILEGSGVGNSIAVSPSGTQIFVSGTGGVALSYRAGDGQEVWQRSLGSFDAAQIGVSPDGTRVFLSGMRGFRSRTFTVQSYRGRSGDFEWSRKISMPGGSSVTDLAVGPSGDLVYAAGSYSTDPTSGFVTAAFHAIHGAKAWMTKVRTKQTGFPTSLAVGPAGRRVVATGRSDADMLTVSYRADTGHVRWARRLKRASEGSDVVIGPNGTTFVTGWRNPGREQDFLTIAYAA
jgi:DNA-binding beta-propeller fold protein YncE